MAAKGTNVHRPTPEQPRFARRLHFLPRPRMDLRRRKFQYGIGTQCVGRGETGFLSPSEIVDREISGYGEQPGLSYMPEAYHAGFSGMIIRRDHGGRSGAAYRGIIPDRVTWRLAGYQRQRVVMTTRLRRLARSGLSILTQLPAR